MKSLFVVPYILVAVGLAAAGQYENVHIDRVSLSNDDTELVFGTDVGVFTYGIEESALVRITDGPFGSPSFVDTSGKVLVVTSDSQNKSLYEGHSLQIVDSSGAHPLFAIEQSTNLPIYNSKGNSVLYSRLLGKEEESIFGLYASGLFINSPSGDAERLLWKAPNSFVRSMSLDDSGKAILVRVFDMSRDKNTFLKIDAESSEVVELFDVESKLFRNSPFGWETAYGHETAGIDKDGDGILSLQYERSPDGRFNYGLGLSWVAQDGTRHELSQFDFGEEAQSGFNYLRSISGSRIGKVFVIGIERAGHDYESNASRLYVLDLDNKSLLRLRFHRAGGDLLVKSDKLSIGTK